MNETIFSTSVKDKSPVLKALRLLAHIADSNKPLALAELSRALTLPKPTTYRLARALEQAGFVQKDPLTRRYQIGSGFDDVALSALRHSAAHNARRLLMNALAERLNARINLVVLKAGNISFAEWVDSTAPLRIDIKADIGMAVHCGAGGKLLLAFGPEELRERIFRSAPFRRYTKNTVTTARALARELEKIRRRGYSEDDQELLPGVNCLAVPVYNHAGHVVAGLTVMAPVASHPLDKLRAHLPDLRACAARISADLGWKPAMISAPPIPPPASRPTPKDLPRMARKAKPSRIAK
jgi:DNA-binding IclR family transcriptional regulator